MANRYVAACGALAVAGVSLSTVYAGGQQQKGTVRTAAPISQSDLPAQLRPEAKIVKGYVPPKTAWGDPQIAGAYTNSDESGIPFERPAQFDGKKLEDVSPAELTAMVKQRQEQTVERTPGLSEFPGATSPLHWFENYRAANSRAWLVTDETDGKVPAATDEANARNAARARARSARGPADSAEDRSMYDRCITRGIPGSMMPAIYGNSYQILQGPGYVVIKYEMVNETRIIPLGPGNSVPPGPGNNVPHLSGKIRRYLGDARGHFEGNTLVVETTNFTDKTAYRGSSDNLKLVEHFKPLGPNTVEWSVTFEDPHTWAKPWTFAMNLTKVPDSQGPFEYACNEGNYGLRNILTAARAEEAAIKEAAAKGIVKAPSAQDPDEGEK
jgi:hypothetical protein